MAEVTTLHDALVEELMDLYDCEKQLTKALPKLVKSAASEELRAALEEHLGETENQVARIEQIFELLVEEPKGKRCAGIAGIIEESAEALKTEADGAVMDALIIAAAQRAEHYEIGVYGTVCAWAEALELDEVATLLHETLDEEKAADQKLSALAELGINEAAAVGAEGEDEDAATEEEETEAGDRPSASAAGSSSGKMAGRGRKH